MAALATSTHYATIYLHNEHLSFAVSLLSFFQLIHKWRPVDVCCKGYSPGSPPSNGTVCLPECPQRCHRGKCVEPDVCECEPGYGGPACSKCKYRVEKKLGRMAGKVRLLLLGSVVLLSLKTAVGMCLVNRWSMQSYYIHSMLMK